MNRKIERFAALWVVICLLLSAVCAVPAAAASAPTLRTTLTDNSEQRGSRRTFDVWARSAAGKKLDAAVTLNGQTVSPTWDDSEKTSYTLTFTREGDNTVVVSASDGGKKTSLTYHIRYKKAAAGEEIGRAVFSVEAFTLGCGYIIEPESVPILEGETSADALLRLLHENGLVGYHGGSTKASFYLAYIADGTSTKAKFEGYAKSGTPKSPRKLSLSPAIPTVLTPHLEKTMTFFDPDDYRNWNGYLGEFVVTNGSGWMYSVNHVFPNVGFADTFLSDGDVVRVQFTLGYGADIGGFGAIGGTAPGTDKKPTGGYFAVADKDALTKAICAARGSGRMAEPSVRTAYAAALKSMETLDETQSRADAAAAALRAALSSSGSSAATTAGTEKTTAGHTTAAAAPGTSAGGSAAGTDGPAQNTAGTTAAGKSDPAAPVQPAASAADDSGAADPTAADSDPAASFDDPSSGDPSDVPESGAADPAAKTPTAAIVVGSIALLCAAAAAAVWYGKKRAAAGKDAGKHD